MIPQQMQMRDLDYSHYMSPKREGKGEETLRKKVFLKIVLPAVVKASIVYLAISLAAGEW